MDQQYLLSYTIRRCDCLHTEVERTEVLFFWMDVVRYAQACLNLCKIFTGLFRLWSNFSTTANSSEWNIYKAIFDKGEECEIIFSFFPLPAVNQIAIVYFHQHIQKKQFDHLGFWHGDKHPRTREFCFQLVVVRHA